jgi:hypothetical protein
MSYAFINIGQDEMGIIMKNINHGMMEGGRNMFYPKGDNNVGKRGPICGECSFIVISMVDLNLVIT